MTQTIIASGTTITSNTFSAANTIFIIRYNFNLNGVTATVNSKSFLLFDGGTLTNGTIYGRTLDGTVRPEWFGAVGDGVTDDSNAIEMAFRFVELSSQNKNDYINTPATIVFSAASRYKVSRSFFLRLGVSVDFNGCYILPDYSSTAYTSYQYSGSATCKYIFFVNWVPDAGHTSGHLQFTYPPRISYIANAKVGVHDNVEFSGVPDLGFLFLGAPMYVHDIFTCHVCPVIGTPLPSVESDNQSQVCYLDCMSIKRVHACWPHQEAVSQPTVPYVIYKPCRGDAWVIEQLANECGLIEKTESGSTNIDVKINAIHFSYTNSLRISDCIHADGIIAACSEVSYLRNHNERYSLTVFYSDITIRDCSFCCASNGLDGEEAALILSEYETGSAPMYRMHSVVLDNVRFIMHNQLQSYVSHKPEVSIWGRGLLRIDYRNVKVSSFAPRPANAGTFIYDTVMPTNGFTFKYRGTEYNTFFRSGRIECANGTVNCTNGHAVKMITTNESPDSHLFDAPEGYRIDTGGSCKYEIRLFCMISRNCAVGLILPEVTLALSTSGSGVVLMLKSDATDGCAVCIRRTRVSAGNATETKYACLPVSYNGVFLDWGGWVNTVQWSDDDPLAGITLHTLEPDEWVEFGETGHVRYHINNVFKALTPASEGVELIDIQDPLRNCTLDHKVYRIQPWSFIRPYDSSVFHVSHGYPSTPLQYENQIFEIRNGRDNSLVEVRITFPGRTIQKKVTGTDFVAVYRDSNYGLYLRFTNSQYHHVDMSVRSNQILNLVDCVYGTHTFPSSSDLTGLTLVNNS